MKFRHVQEKLNPNGSTETLATDFEVDELIIGRGGNSNLLLSGRLISLVHAKLRWSEGQLWVEDQDSMAGVRVNGKRTSREALCNGDEIRIGDIKFSVEITSDVVSLKQVSTPTSKESVEDLVHRQASLLSIASHLPSMTFLSLFGLLIIVFFYWFMPTFGANRLSWSSGPLANPHKMVESDCEACHTKPFVQVQDAQCLQCHNMTEHAHGFNKLVSHKPELGMRCAQCHMDHNGDQGVTVKESQLCTSCHANIKQANAETQLMSVASFADHGQFHVSVDDGSGKTIRVPVDDKAKAIDRSGLKLNHALHLKTGLRGKDGPVTLECSSCHELAKDFRTIKPINFENHCQECHSLGFDPEIPDAQVPHGDNAAVYPALFTEYMKYLLLKSDDSSEPAPPAPPAEFERMLPGGTRAPVAAANIKPANVNAGLVEKRSRAAERNLYERTACYMCHETAQTPVDKRTSTNAHYQVVEPKVPDQWLTKAIFGHGAHEEVSCESCHQEARKSSKTSDVLLPGIADCRGCHAQGDKQGFVNSECILCHSYHDALGIPAEKKKSIADYLSDIQR